MPQAPLSSDGGPSEGRRSIDSTDESGPGAGSAAPGARHLKGPSQMRDQRTNSGVPGRPASKRCSACRAIKTADEFYADRRGRLTAGAETAIGNRPGPTTAAVTLPCSS